MNPKDRAVVGLALEDALDGPARYNAPVIGDRPLPPERTLTRLRHVAFEAVRIREGLAAAPAGPVDLTVDDIRIILEALDAGPVASEPGSSETHIDALAWAAKVAARSIRRQALST